MFQPINDTCFKKISKYIFKPLKLKKINFYKRTIVMQNLKRYPN